MNVDLTIVAAYLIGTLWIGIKTSKHIKTVEDYAVYNRSLPLSVFIATIFATWIGGESTLGMAERVFSIGIVYILVFFGSAINKLIIAQFLAPKFSQFQDCISVGDIIGKCYGRIPRIITGSFATLSCIVTVGAQVSAISFFLQTFFGTSFLLGAIIGSTVLVVYSTFGGIKAVAFTDLFQFFIIVVTIPMIFNLGISEFGSIPNLLKQVPENHLRLFPPNESSFKYIALFIIFSTPFLNPAITQRLLMAKDITKVVKAMKVSAFIEFPFYIAIGFIGLIALALNPHLDPNSAMPYLINELLPTGVRGFAIAGILAIIMSTADSFLNAAGVSFIHDVVDQLRRKPLEAKQKLLLSKVATFALGMGAIISALGFKNIFDVIMNSFNFWAPLVVVPLYAGLYGVRASSKVFIYAAVSGVLTNILWGKIGLESALGFGGLVPSIIANGLVFFLVYYNSRKDGFTNHTHLPHGKHKTHNINTNFSLLKTRFFDAIYSKLNSYTPQYIVFGIFILINYALPYFMWSPTDIRNDTVLVLRLIASCMGFLLVVKDYWPRNLKKFLPLYWYAALTYCLPFMATLMFVKNSGDILWTINMGITLLFLVILVDWISFIAITFLGVTSAYTVFALGNNVNEFAINYNNAYLSVYLYTFAILIGGIFSRNKERSNLRVINSKDIANHELRQIVEDRTLDLKEALSAKQEFLGKVSHEMRTPLQGIIATSQTLHARWKNFSDAEKYRLASIVANSGSRLMGLMNNILDLSQFSLGQIKAVFVENIDISALIDDAIKIAETLPDSEHKNITFKVEVDANVKKRSLECDSTRITQVLINLLNNAISYSDGGEIIIKATQVDGKLQVSVIDNGVGIPEKEKTMIFEAFTQSSRTKDPSKGKGLGLAICTEIIGLHHGHIWAENNKNKPGSTLSFVIPYEQGLAKAKAVEIQNVEVAKLKLTGRILLVDDEDICLQTGGMCLSALGLEVVAANGGKAAIEYLKAHPKEIDLILLDLMMPDMYGLNVLKILKADSNLKDIPVIIQSGLLDSNEIATALKLGAVGHIPKPYSIRVMHDAIKKLFGQKELLAAA